MELDAFLAVASLPILWIVAVAVVRLRGRADDDAGAEPTDQAASASGQPQADVHRRPGAGVHAA